MTWGPTLYRLLNGVFCVYKPKGVHCNSVVEHIQRNLAKDLNGHPCYPYERKMREIEPNPNVKTPSVTTEPRTLTTLSDHKLVLGERYIPPDFRVHFVTGLNKHSSGVLVCSVGSGREYLSAIKMARYLRVYHVRGKFGWATDNFSPKGKIMNRSTYHHVKKSILDKVCATVQAGHQRFMFDYAGVTQDSQEAYELAAAGIVRPEHSDTPPMIYGCHVIDFSLPDFTLEIHSINETQNYLMKLIHEIGLELRSTAICTQVRRIRYGHFTLEHALLCKHWTAQEIIRNIATCKHLLTPNRLLTDLSITEAEGDVLQQLADGQKPLLIKQGPDKS
ncbi:hypothetical protein ACJMK2_040005 [Sinanodonta woodiana]|uniref:Pseudouridine synthase II N-terminal domain-containing protein n=1 Tax=Sinanodonta woodiana TaxID=1069815 RepID=A0ABD3WDU7_SINWO